MSHDSEKTHPHPPLLEKNSEENAASWLQIQHDLRGALDTWTTLSQKSTGKKTAEEKSLEDMRRLLADLKSRMKEFE